jgi:hypothetical protein
MLEERDALYDKLDAGKITKVELHEEMKKSGHILILSNRKMKEQEAYVFADSILTPLFKETPVRF